MDPATLTPRLNELIRLDADRALAFDAALRRARELAAPPAVWDALHDAHAEHLLHVQALSQLVRELGGVPAAPEALSGPPYDDPDGPAESLARPPAGLRPLHRALIVGERTIVAAYEHLLAQPLSNDARALLGQFLRHEREHLRLTRKAAAGTSARPSRPVPRIRPDAGRDLWH